MLRNLIKNYGRSLILFSPQCTLKSGNQKQRFLFCPAPLRTAETAPVSSLTVNDADSEYIVPYKLEHERPESAKNLMKTLRKKFGLSKEEVDNILTNETVLKVSRERSLVETLDVLYMEGVKKANFVEYPWLITLDKKKLLEKLTLLKSMNGFRDINDFVPFLRLSLPRMRNLVFSLNRESKSIDHGNRVYFLAEKLNVSPATVTKYMANRLFVLEMPLELFKTNLQNMIKYNVEPMSLLRDLWGFRYSPKSVELRLKRALKAKKNKIMPWMVRCPEPILQKSLQLSLDELEVLDGRASIAEYVGDRLGFCPEEAQAIMNRHPQVNTVKVTKIKEVLDYLLDEAKFTRYEVAQVPRILCHSLETTKERIEELKKYGCRPSSLVIVCRSKKEYEKFLNQWAKPYKYNRSNKYGSQEQGEK